MKVYERCGIKPCGIGMNCDVMEWVEKNTLKWFDHIERKKGEEFVPQGPMLHLSYTLSLLSLSHLVTPQAPQITHFHNMHS